MFVPRIGRLDLLCPAWLEAGHGTAGTKRLILSTSCGGPITECDEYPPEEAESVPKQLYGAPGQSVTRRKGI